MKTGTYIQESAKLSSRNDDGSYDVVIITEGTGSTGVYAAELMREDQAILFENAPSFMNHPIDPSKPYLRDVMSISGRFTNLRAGVSEGKAAILGRFKPRREYAEFVEEFHDVLGLSIFSLANGEKDDTGKVVVESFADVDPYRSVDIVVAAGRGGKFQRAEESARTIEASLGHPEGTTPGAAPAPGTHTQEEGIMKPEDITALAEALTNGVKAALEPVITFVTEQKTAAEAAAAGAPAAGEAIKSAISSAAAIEAAGFGETLKASLLKDLEAGKDVTAAIEFAKTVTAEAAAAAKPVQTAVSEYVIESAPGVSHDFSIAGLAA